MLTREIDNSTLKALLNENPYLKRGCHWSSQLEKWGYSLVFKNINFAELVEENSLLMNCAFEGITFENCKGFGHLYSSHFTDCHFKSCHFYETRIAHSTIEESNFEECRFELTILESLNCIKSHFKDCHFLSCRITNVRNLNSDEYNHNNIDTKTLIMRCAWENAHHQQPLIDKHIAIVYVPEDGTDNINVLISHLQKKALQLVLLHPDTAFRHPVLQKMSMSGIILPGGPHIEEEENDRSQLEVYLLRHALKNKIPLLGICRGHQLVALTLFPRARLFPVKGHTAEQHPIFINPLSQLHQHFKKMKGIGSLSQHFGMFCTTTPTCHHQQAIALEVKGRDAAIVNSRAGDGTIEGIEYRDIITTQHHYEQHLNKKDTRGDFARFFFTFFLDKVEGYQPVQKSTQGRLASARL